VIKGSTVRANSKIFGQVERPAVSPARKGAEMIELRINASKAEQIIAQVLHDENGMSPSDAIAVAASICRRLTAVMPTSPSLDRYRIISKEPPSGSDFAVAVAEKLTEEKSELWNASVLWELVYNQGNDLRAN
jgi:hypothetical protein